MRGACVREEGRGWVHADSVGHTTPDVHKFKCAFESRGRVSISMPTHAVADRPQVRFQKIRFENFKSFAGVVEFTQFHPSYTSIIGPNGSGKSNVIDGLLFVFGYKAAKLRMKNLSELIHQSAAHGRLSSASVALTLGIPDGGSVTFARVRSMALCSLQV